MKATSCSNRVALILLPDIPSVDMPELTMLIDLSLGLGKRPVSPVGGTSRYCYSV